MKKLLTVSLVALMSVTAANAADELAAKTYVDGAYTAAVAAAKTAGDAAYDAKGAAGQALTDAKSYTDTEIGKINTEISELGDTYATDAEVETALQSYSTTAEMEAELAKKVDNTTFTSFQTTNTAAIEAAKKAGDDAQADVDALEGVVATKAAQADLTALSTNLTTNYSTTTATQGLIDTAVSGIQGQIDSLGDDYATDDEMSAGLALKADKATYEAYVTSNDAAVAAAKKAGDDAQADVDALEGVVATKAAQADLTALSTNLTTNYSTTTATQGLIDTAVSGIQGQIDSLGDEYATDDEVTTALQSYSTTEQMNAALDLKANAANVYTKTEADGAFMDSTEVGAAIKADYCPAGQARVGNACVAVVTEFTAPASL